ncbi:MAG TPA: DEAD/DEAH box helicase [Streptosporangiaceae bacterium]|nr:DEAD/DEAH box helicase [Streptosporangiaceae bacterium]
MDARLVSALASRGITEPFAIQARALPDALAGRNVLGRAQTGSGKTLAFGIPLLARVALSSGLRRDKAPLGLVLVPTRELAKQVADVLSPLGRSVGVSITTVYGGVPIGRQIDRVRTADIVVATPGRLVDLLERHACTLGSVEITVLDEADHMADLGFLPTVTDLLSQTPEDGQRMFFSATLDRGVGKLVTSFVTDPALHAVPVSADEAGSGAAEHSLLVLSAADKVPVATEIASRPGRTLFFVRTKHGADRLAQQLERSGVGAAAIHGNRNQSQRQRALDAFAAGHPRVLVATDVAARGIHVDDVDLVVQFDPPNDHKDYLHRSGRTARAGATGQVISLVERGQVREMQRLHSAAGITAAQHDVAVGHNVVREFATSGTPVPPPPANSPRSDRSDAGDGSSRAGSSRPRRAPRPRSASASGSWSSSGARSESGYRSSGARSESRSGGGSWSPSGSGSRSAGSRSSAGPRTAGASRSASGVRSA